jgi:hypothetical protein
MSAPKTSKYTFLPWVKTGLGASIPNNEQELEGPRAKIQAKLSVRRFNALNNPSDDLISKDYFLYGPGDIQGILNSVIIRTEPIANYPNFEPNYFPFIEFSQPDFPWKYTPARPGGAQPAGRLSPWLSLILLQENEFDRRPPEVGLLPQIEIRDPQTSLPDLEQSWAWAHTQIIQELSNPESLREILASEPYKVTSRILSLRRLNPNSHYFAFVVPTFELGRLAGLGVPADDDIKGTTFAWSVHESPKQYLLPVYYQWEFSTSPSGDFESLARKLEDRVLPREVGIKKLDVSEAFLSISNNKVGFDKPLFFGGALWSNLAKEFVRTRKKINIRTYRIEGPDPEEENPSPEEIKEFIMEMKELVDLGERLTWSFVESPHFSNECEDPVISPPMYGKWHARKRLVSKISDNYEDPLWIKSLGLEPPQGWLEEIRKDFPYEWLEQLNLDPTNRVAAGIGAAVIHKLQEELMASAWDQAGQLQESNKHLRISQLAREISSNIYERCFQPLKRDVLITMVSTFHSRATVEHDNKAVSVKRLLRDSSIPDAIFSPAFTKISTKYLKTRSSDILDHLNKRGSRDMHASTLEASKPGSIMTLDYLVDSPIIDGQHIPITEGGFRGRELDQYLQNGEKREMVRSIENSIPNAEATVEEPEGVVEASLDLDKIHAGLINSLDPKLTIEAKVSKEVTRLERLQENTKDKLDIIVAYPEFKRPMFEPLRELSEEILFPGIMHIPQNTIGLLQTNPTFINSYMVGLNHEMAKELLWRGYPTDQRGSYFRQFWDASAAVERERLKHFQEKGTFPSEKEDEEIIEKYRDIPEIHRWNESTLEEIQGTAQPERQVLLIRGELLMRFPGAVIYAIKAKPDHANNNKPVLSSADEDIKEPVFRGTIPPDITFLGFDIPIEDLLGNDEIGDPGYFFIIQEQPSEPRFAIDNGNIDNGGDDSTGDHTLPQSWNELKWHHVESSLGSNNYIDLETEPLKGIEIDNVIWGSHAADLAYILLQQPVRIAVHARELLRNLIPGQDDEP